MLCAKLEPLVSSPKDIFDVLVTDLGLTETYLRAHPKVYWIWNHRRWCLQNVPNGPTEDDPKGWETANWKKELFVVEKMLNVDARNCTYFIIYPLRYS